MFHHFFPPLETSRAQTDSPAVIRLSTVIPVTGSPLTFLKFVEHFLFREFREVFDVVAYELAVAFSRHTCAMFPALVAIAIQAVNLPYFVMTKCVRIRFWQRPTKVVLDIRFPIRLALFAVFIEMVPTAIARLDAHSCRVDFHHFNDTGDCLADDLHELANFEFHKSSIKTLLQESLLLVSIGISRQLRIRSSHSSAQVPLVS
jgi:hypothetical protein